MIHTLTPAERIEFLNAIIQVAIQKENEASKDWMSQGCTYYRFYSPEFYNHDSDEKIHAYMDRAKVPRQVSTELWESYLRFVEEQPKQPK